MIRRSAQVELTVGDTSREEKIAHGTVYLMSNYKSLTNLIIMANSRILSFNCEGVKNCMSYLSNLLKDTNCDILCLQETWTLDNTIDILGSIYIKYNFTGISGVSNDHILRGRPSGGVGILIKKTLSKYVTFMKSPCKRISAIKIKCANNFSCLLANV